MKRTTIWISDEDRHAIRRIQRRFGVATDSDAVRLALRILAEAQDIGLAPMPPTGRSSEETGGGERVRARRIQDARTPKKESK